MATVKLPNGTEKQVCFTMKEAAQVCTQAGFIRWAEGTVLNMDDFKPAAIAEAWPHYARSR